MNRDQFLNNDHVLGFLDWVVPHLESLKVNLVITSSHFVPGGVNIKATGIEAVTDHYMWKSVGMDSGDWEVTQKHCSQLAKDIQDAVENDHHSGALDAAWRVIQWGGGSRGKGAYKFLSELDNDLIPYLKRTKEAFTLATADTEKICFSIKNMNAMQSKVHAFLAMDGLPIYDSRVAVAIATFVEAWRRGNVPAQIGIPEPLHFPSLNPRNKERIDISRKFPDAVKPKRLNSGAKSILLWSDAMIRLGWLMEKILDDHPDIFKHYDTLPARMRSLEAALFMVGYDVKCLA